LPPFRSGHDYHIPLIQGVNAVSKRPCRFAKNQKDAINKLIQEYLASGIIQDNCSP